MTTPYNAIDSSLIAAGKLWLPQLTWLFMGRDWGLAEGSFDIDYPASTLSVTTTNYSQAFASFYLRFPSGWAADTTFASLTTTVSVTFDGSLTSGTGFYYRLNPTSGTIDSRNEVYCVDGPGYVEQDAATVTFTGVPTGVVEFEIQVKNDGTTTFSRILRNFGEKGCDCYVQVDQ